MSERRHTEDAPWHDGFIQLERFAESERGLGDDSEIVDLVLGEVGDAERRHVGWTDADLCPVTATCLSFLDDVPLDRVPSVVERRRPVNRKHVSRHSNYPDWSVRHFWWSYNRTTFLQSTINASMIASLSLNKQQFKTPTFHFNLINR